MNVFFKNLTFLSVQNQVKNNSLVKAKKSLITIEDDEIERILKLDKKVRVFLVQRLNGKQCWVSLEVARIKYPDAVMSFYEQRMMPKVEKVFFLKQIGLQPISTPKRYDSIESNRSSGL